MISGERKAEDILRKRFHELERTIDAFSDIKYVGTRTRVLPTDFKQLTETIRQQLNNNSIRAQRRPEIVYQSLKVSGGNALSIITLAIRAHQ